MTHSISYAQFNTVSMEKSFNKVEVAASDNVDDDNRRGIVSTPVTVITEHVAR